MTSATSITRQRVPFSWLTRDAESCKSVFCAKTDTESKIEAPLPKDRMKIKQNRYQLQLG